VTQGPYHGLYINLDRSPERRRQFEQQLKELHLEERYARFSAVDGRAVNAPGCRLNPGQIGAFHSHYRALEQARHQGRAVHILEDDALLSEHVVPVIEGAIADNLFERCDLLFTDMLVFCHVGFLKTLKWKFDEVAGAAGRPLRFQQFRLFDLSEAFYAAFQSYVVGPRSIDRVLLLYREAMRDGLQVPVDIFIQQQVLAGKLRAVCLFPFITSARLADVVDSTILEQRRRAGHPSIMVMAVLRYLFFLGCDLDYAKQTLDAATRLNRRTTDTRQALMAQATEFILSDDFIEST
jgi:GR25 family glycosyltransferase involved in LPS biosynthesis